MKKKKFIKKYTCLDCGSGIQVVVWPGDAFDYLCVKETEENKNHDTIFKDRSRVKVEKVEVK